MSKIIGNTVGMGLPKPNLMQTDPTKGDYVKGKEQFLEQAGGGTVTDEQIAEAVEDYMAEHPVTPGATVEPAEDDIPKVFFGGALQPNKNEKVVPFRYISKTQDFSGYAEIKAQGNTSLTFPKKNQTVKMFKDADCTEKLKVDFKGWGKQNKYVYKANWIDLSHARNVVSARLWGDVVKSRANYAELPELLRTSPNHGAVDGFPVKVYAAGVYQGRYTLNIPKDKWTYNMDDDLEEHCVLYSENYVSGCFRAAAIINGSDWTDEIHDTVPASVKTRWNEVISFVMNSTDEEFKANLSQYFYVDSLLDYYLFCLASCGLDAFGKNQIYMTYDGQRWIASAYDMDSTWGLYWNGSKFVATNYARTSYEDYVHTDGNLLYNRLEQLFWAELQARWAELKNGALTIENIINHFERFTDITPLDLVKEDYASTTGGGSFVNIPSKDTNNIQQLRSFALARLAWTDTYVKGLTQVIPVPCEGITLNTATLTFTAEGTQTLTATVIPDGCTDAVTWESNNTNVATVADGVVASVANGSAVITAKCGKYSASCSVSVTGIYEPIPCTGISLDTTTHSFTAVGASKTLIATATPADTTDSILWESSNNAVATVAQGVVTSVGDGDCVITAKCGNYSATCNVSVSVSVDPVLPTDSILYELAEATTFDGVDDYVDTGVSLYSTDSDFSVCLDFAGSGNNSDEKAIFHSMKEASGYPGFDIQLYAKHLCFNANMKQYFTTGVHSNYLTVTERVRVVVVKDSKTGTITAYAKSASFEKTLNGTDNKVTFNQNALLGAYQTTNGTKGRFWSGTIYGCTIFSRCLTADEIAAFCV